MICAEEIEVKIWRRRATLFLEYEYYQHIYECEAIDESSMRAAERVPSTNSKSRQSYDDDRCNVTPNIIVVNYNALLANELKVEDGREE